MRDCSLKEDWRRGRKIVALFVPGSASWIRLGFDGVDSIDAIEVYEELGQMAAVPWLAVISGGTVIRKINAAHVEQIQYAAHNDGANGG